MIKNALASADADTDLWSQLKSIDHTLTRILSGSASVQLTDLDRERLKELASFLQERVLQGAPAPLSAESLLRESRMLAGLPADFRDRINNLESFKNWQATARVGFEKKVQKLIHEIEQFEHKATPDFFPGNATKPDFMILKDIVAALLVDIETTLI